MLLGQAGETKIDLDDIEQRLSSRTIRAWRNRCRTSVFRPRPTCSPPTPARRATWPRGWQDAQINRDRNLRLQYLAGLRSNWYRSEAIHQEMAAFRKFPDGLFDGSDASTLILKIGLAAAAVK